MSEGNNFEIHIGDLPISVDEDFLISFLSDSAVPLGLKLKEHRFGGSKYAFVQFHNREEASKVIEELNFTKLDGRALRMSFADPETKRLIKTGVGNLFIKNLDVSIEVSQLYEAFNHFGEIVSCKIPYTDSKPRGYGFVQFRKKEDADKAKIDLAEATFNGRKIEIRDYHKPNRTNPEQTYTNIYIKELPITIDSDKKLQELFSQFGEIQNVAIHFSDGLPYGFCNMVKHEDAERAVKELSGKVLDDKELVVSRAMTRKRKAILFT